MSQSGLAPLFVVIIAVVAALGIGGAIYYQVRIHKTSETSVGAQMEKPAPPRENAENQEPTPYTETSSLQKPTQKQKLQSPPAVTSSQVHRESELPQGLNAQFSAIEQELTQGKTSGSFIGEEHYARIVRDLDSLEKNGYLKEGISQLRAIALELAPHLKDKAAQGATGTSTQSGTMASPANVCGGEPPKLTEDITDFGKIRRITAPGSPSHEGPKGHSFIGTEHERVPVYMPVAATLDSGSYSKDNADSPAQYLLFFTLKDNCNFQIKFDHIDDPIPEIKVELSATPTVANSRTSPVTHRIELKAGELVGYTSGTAQAGNWDFGLYNTKEKGVLALQYNSYGMHGYAVCWVDFYAPGKQEKYRALLEGPKLLCSF